MNRIGISVRLVCAPSLAHTRRVLRFPGRSFPEHHAFSLRPSAAPAPEFYGTRLGRAAQVSQVAQPAYLFHETRPFSQLVHLLFTYTEPLSRKTTRRSDCIPVSPSFKQMPTPHVEAFKRNCVRSLVGTGFPLATHTTSPRIFWNTPLQSRIPVVPNHPPHPLV